MLRQCFAVAAVWMAAACLPAGTASGAGKNPFNVDVRVGWGGAYRPEEWTPVEVGITGKLKEPFGGVLCIEAGQDGLTRSTVRSDFVLTPDVPVRLPLVSKFSSDAYSCEVRIHDADGQVRWSKEISLNTWPAESLGDNELLIGLCGRQTFGLPALGKHTVCTDVGEIGKVRVGGKLPRMLPWDWTGLACLDLLVLYDPDWARINAHQTRAIVDWVAGGGRLLVVLGSHPLGPEHAIANILPARPDQIAETALLPGGYRWGISPAPAKVPVWSLVKNPQAVGLSYPLSRGRSVRAPRLFAVGIWGFGRVGVMAFDPAALGEVSDEAKAVFWTEHAKVMLAEAGGLPKGRQIRFSNDVSGETNVYDDYRERTSLANKGTDAVLAHLLAVPQLKPIGIGWVVLLLVGMAALLGPVEYLALRRLGHLPMTWITSAAWIALFTVGAYHGVRIYRGGEMQIQAVSVVDGIAGHEGGWVTSYSGLFAPDSDDYALVHADDAPSKQWWSSVAPGGGDYYNDYGESGLATRHITCSQRDGSNMPLSLPISIWSMQCMLTESRVKQLPLDATVSRDGNTISVTVTNRSDTPITGGTVRYSGDEVLQFTGVGPKATETFSGRCRTGTTWAQFNEYEVDPDDYIVDAEDDYQGRQRLWDRDRTVAYVARGAIRRSRGIIRLLSHGAAVVCAEYDEAPLPYLVAERDCTVKHSQLVRLVVWPSNTKRGLPDDRD